jgi:transposase InsO family protein
MRHATRVRLFLQCKSCASRYILAWKLCTTMSATDVSDTLQVALRGSGLNQVKVLHRPRLLSDNGPSYVSSELGKWLEDNGIRHIRGRPYHPMTQGKIERTGAHLHCTRSHSRNFINRKTTSKSLCKRGIAVRQNI